MTFPVTFHILGRPIPAHAVCELAAYTLGFQLYLYLRRRNPRVAESLPLEKNLWIIVGCVLGALVGSKILAILESPEYWNADPLSMLGGKTIVGGLLGGWIGVEFAKSRLGVHQSTGDGFVFPLILGIAIGRIGCFLTGLPDHTYGNKTNLPWAVDFGDGPRHPTQLYEIAFLIVLGLVLLIFTQTGAANSRERELAVEPRPPGALFRLFMLSYLLFRLAVEFIKPTFKPYLGMSAIQISCLVGATCCVRSLLKLRQRHAPMPPQTPPMVKAAL
jgi:prolipoprotein diacylglyceryltransferase